MGIAEVIPGVSGGTVAFITGIYEDLIASIKSFGPQAYRGWKKEGMVGFWNAINGNFLLFLLIGMLIGFFSGVFIISDLIDNQPEILWGFFFGLILASCILIGLEIKSWDLSKLLALIVGVVIAFGVTTLAPAEGSLNLFYVFFSAVIAISALMLPGVSGSFMLLIMGMYTLIIPTIKRVFTDFAASDLLVITVFGSGALTGLALFSRLLSYLFNSYRSVSFAILTGFMIGSLNKIWPWRNVTSVLLKDTGEAITIAGQDQLLEIGKDNYKILSEQKVFPADYIFGDSKVLGVFIAMIFGIMIVYLLHLVNTKK